MQFQQYLIRLILFVKHIPAPCFLRMEGHMPQSEFDLDILCDYRSFLSSKVNNIDTYVNIRERSTRVITDNKVATIINLNH